MEPPTARTAGRSVARVARVGRLLCLAGGSFGALGLFGWISGMTILTTIVSARPQMMPNTALSLFLVAVAGVLRVREDARPARRLLSVVAALVVLVIGAGTLTEYATGVNLGVDQVLVQGLAGPYPGRPSPPTALALTLIASALLLFDFRPSARIRPSEWLILAAAVTALAGLMGITFGVDAYYRLHHAPVIGVALPTAISLLLITSGLLLERPRAGVMRLALSPGPGGMLLRRLAIPAILAPMLFGIVVTRVFHVVGVEEVQVVAAVLAASLTVTGLAQLARTAAALDRAHQALGAAQALARDLVEQAADGIFVADLNGRYTDVNRAGCQMLGYSREEILAMTILDLIRAEDAGRLWRSKDELLAGGVEVSEWLLRRKDGTQVPVEVSAKILPDGRWQGFVRDIGERKRLEEELRVAEAKASGILAVSSDAIISIDADQRISMFNEGAAKIFGYSRAEAIGAPLDMLMPERFRAMHRLYVDRFAAGREVARSMGERGAAIFGLRKNGEEFPADAAIAKLEVAGTRILTVTLRDVTEQKRIEGEQRFLAEVGPILATSLEYEKTLAEVAALAVRDLADVCIIDVAETPGVGTAAGDIARLEVTSRDPARDWVCDLFRPLPGQREHPRIVRPVLSSRRPVLLERLSPEAVASLAEGNDHLRRLREAGLQSAVVVPLLAHDRLLGAIALVSTTASRVYRAADLRLVEELAYRAALSIENARLYRAAGHAVRARDDVLGIVAHDLRNPLNTILLQAGVLHGEGAIEEGRVRQGAQMIERAAKRMNRLIQDLLDVTRMEAGRLSIVRAGVAVPQVVSDSLEAQQPLAASASLQLTADVADDVPALWADRDRLLQVFENLIGNALKFTQPGGRITVGAAPRDGEVLLWVADTGIGIAAEDVPRLFDRFWQLRRTGRRGAGLGLPIAKGIIEAHGGRIWVDSQPGRGSTFFFTMPAAPFSCASSARPPATQEERSEGR